jgi:plastocyanin
MRKQHSHSSTSPAPGQAKSTNRRRLSISTVIILLLAAFAGVAYYLGTPPPTPSAATPSVCPVESAEVVIPQGIGTNPAIHFQPPVLTLIVGVNNTAVWDDQDTTSVHNVISVSGPEQWTFEGMTGGNSYCVTIATPGKYTYSIYLPYQEVGTIIVKTGA